MSEDQDPRDVALDACASGARVLVIKTDGERLEGHIDQLLHGGFHIVARTPTGRLRLSVWYADVASMAEFIDEPDLVEGVDDDLMALARHLRSQAAREGEKSLAERMISNPERES